MTDTDASDPVDETRYETRVPPGESPVECPYCGRPLESERLLVLHEGLDHWERIDEERRETFRETYTGEREDLRTFRLKMLALLVVVYFAFLFVYSYVSNDPYSMVNAGFLLFWSVGSWK